MKKIHKACIGLFHLFYRRLHKKHKWAYQEFSGILEFSQGLKCRKPWFNSWVGKFPWRRDRLPTPVFLGFPEGSNDKESVCNARGLGSIPGLGRSPGGGHGNPLQYSCLRIPWTEDPGELQSVGSQRVRHNWATKRACTRLHLLSAAQQHRLQSKPLSSKFSQTKKKKQAKYWL